MLTQANLPDPDYDAWLSRLQAAEDAAGRLSGTLQTLEQNPAQVQSTLLAAYRAAGTILHEQQTVLTQAETVLEQQLARAQTDEERARLEQLLAENQAAQERLQQSIAENQAQQDSLAAMSEEEIAAQIDSIAQNTAELQQTIAQTEALVQQAQASGLDWSTVADELSRANDILAQGLSQARGALSTADEAFALADDIFLTANDTLTEIEQIMDAVTAAYDARWSGMLDAAFADLYSALGDLDAVLAQADEALPNVNSLLSEAADAQQKGGALLDYLSAALPGAKEELARLSAVMSNLSDENLAALIDFLETDSESAADYFSSPVELKEERLYHLDNYGSAMAPFYTILSLWVGCLLLSAVLSVEARPFAGRRASTPLEEYFGKFLTFLTLVVGQALIVALGDKYVLGIEVANLPLFLTVSVFSSFIFILIVYSMVSISGVVGKAACVILLVFQIAGAGGTFPVDVMPEFFQTLQPYLPFTYAIGAMREAVCGPSLENLLLDFRRMLVFGMIGLLIGVLLKRPLQPIMEWFNAKFRESGLGE